MIISSLSLFRTSRLVRGVINDVTQLWGECIWSLSCVLVLSFQIINFYVTTCQGGTFAIYYTDFSQLLYEFLDVASLRSTRSVIPNHWDAYRCRDTNHFATGQKNFGYKKERKKKKKERKKERKKKKKEREKTREKGNIF